MLPAHGRLLGAQRVLYLELWRWALFFAGFAPIYYASRLLVQGLVLGVESKLFTTRQAMYYAVSIQVPVLAPWLTPAPVMALQSCRLPALQAGHTAETAGLFRLCKGMAGHTPAQLSMCSWRLIAFSLAHDHY